MSRTLTLVLTLVVLNYCALSNKRGHQIPIVDDGEKWEQHGSIVLYSSKDSTIHNSVCFFPFQVENVAC